MKESRNQRRGSHVLLGATIASLLATVVAGYLTRSAIAAADAWVAHTDEVKLSIRDCQLALARDDAGALHDAEVRVGSLTIDNPLQQQNIDRAASLAQDDHLDALFGSMLSEEDRLMVERLDGIQATRVRSAIITLLGATLTLAFGAGMFAMMRMQRRDLWRQNALLEAVLDSVDEGIIALAQSGEIVAMNSVARSLWGTQAPQGRWPSDWRPFVRATYEDGSSMKPEDGPLARALRGDPCERVVYRVVPGDEELEGRWIAASSRSIRDELGRTVAAVSTLRDITEQRAQAERLLDQSLTDELTGLFNRRGFLTLAKAKMAEARKTQAPMAMLYADVNGLKRINDELGHEQGDRVIEDAAKALRAVFRTADVVARIGGDEFAALLPNFAPAAREPLLERLANAIRAHEEQGRPFRLSLSYGITAVDWAKEPSLDELLAEADRRMYSRKRERAAHSVPVVKPVRPV